MDSPYNRKKKRITQTNTSITETQTHTPNEDTKSFKKTKKYKKNKIIKGGSLLEDQGENSDYITIAGNVIDNTFY